MEGIEDSQPKTTLEDHINYIQQQLENQMRITHDQEIQMNLLKEKLNQQVQHSITPVIPKPQLHERLPALKEFSGNRQEWDAWYLGAEHKLRRDGAALGDEFDQFMYLYARMTGEAREMVVATVRTLTENGSGHGTMFLEYLDTVFGDPNKRARAQQELYNLKQKERESFSTFLPKFETILANAGWSCYAEEQKISLLKNALSKEMRTALIGSPISQTWTGFLSQLQTISSDLVAISQQFRPQIIFQQGRPSNQNPSRMDWEPTKSNFSNSQDFKQGPRAQWVDRETLALRRKKKLCVRCGNQGHIPPQCKFLPPLKPISKITTIKTDIEEDEELMALIKPEDMSCFEGKEELLH